MVSKSGGVCVNYHIACLLLNCLFLVIKYSVTKENIVSFILLCMLRPHGWYFFQVLFFPNKLLFSVARIQVLIAYFAFWLWYS